MHCVREIKKDIFWVGGNDRRISLFENVFPVPNGVSYNSYLIKDEKTILMDTVDKSISSLFFENLEFLLKDKPLDFIVVNHAEPDHCATIVQLIDKYPNVKIITNKKTITIIKQFFDFDIESASVVVEEGDIIDTGAHSFTFFMAPMVHWPEVMVTYDIAEKVMFSADAFGSFGALNGSIFADEVDFEHKWLDESRRYYSNIVGKYGAQVQQLIKKLSTLDISMICPLHGPVWRKNIAWYIDKYNKWSSFAAEEKAVLIAYASVYGNTENAVEILASKLYEGGVTNLAMYDVSSTHPSIIVSEAFRCSHIVFASTTYNGGIFCNMDTVLTDLKEHFLQNRTVAIIENGSWGPTAGKLITNIVASMKNMSILEEKVTIKSSIKEEQLEAIDKMAKAIINDLNSK